MTSSTVIQDLIKQLAEKADELKDFKGLKKELEDDMPMELEDLMLTLKDLKKQVKERKEEHIKFIIENQSEYTEYRERIQLLKEEIAQAKLELFTMAANEAREKGELDKKVVVNGLEHRLQTQREMQVYLDGKVVK